MLISTRITLQRQPRTATSGALDSTDGDRGVCHGVKKKVKSSILGHCPKARHAHLAYMSGAVFSHCALIELAIPFCRSINWACNAEL
jgi:hypothetical protein